MSQKKCITYDKTSPIYQGSVQNLYPVIGEPDKLVSEMTSGGSVFDVGNIFTIAGSEVSRTSFRHSVYQALANRNSWHNLEEYIRKHSTLYPLSENTLLSQLEEYKQFGMNSHHLGMVDWQTGFVHSVGVPEILSNLTLIQKFPVYKPILQKVMNNIFYDYSALETTNKYVIPLEYAVRFGITINSSIVKKYSSFSPDYQQQYLKELGVNRLDPGDRLSTPIVDFSTKFEPIDRNIPYQEASLISHVSGNSMVESINQALLISYLIHKLLDQAGLELWDLKLEFAIDGEKLVLVDTIDTDSMRTTYTHNKKGNRYLIHFSKQAMRDYYQIFFPKWCNAVKSAKSTSRITGEHFSNILQQGQEINLYPPTPEVDSVFLDIQSQKLALVAKKLRQQNRQSNAEFISLAEAEVDYYLQSDAKKSYEQLNCV